MNIGLSKNINIGLPPQIRSSRNTLFEVFLLILVCALFFWFIFLPKKSVVDAKTLELAKYSKEESTMADNLNTLQTLIADLKAHSQDVKRLDEAMPLDGSTINFQLAIQDLANASGVAVGDISVSGKNNAVLAGDTALLNDPFGATRTLQKISGTAYVIGTFPQLTAFLKKVEANARIMQISSFDVGGTQNNNLNLKISFTSYYLAP